IRKAWSTRLIGKVKRRVTSAKICTTAIWMVTARHTPSIISSMMK
ncbi:tonB-dependent Receptor Plug domain protein, partial [Vibrio parahaemolyticus V-223/04]